MRLADVIQLLANGDDTLRRIAVLGRELLDLDARRAEIVAELAALGVSDAPAAPAMRDLAAAEPPAGRPNMPLSEDEAWRQAYETVMANHIADFNRSPGEPEDEQRLQRETQRRRPQIDAMAAQLRQQSAAAGETRCEDCFAAATTVIGGRHYCDEHAADAPRPTPLRLVR